jgi:hypothetical protein
MSDCNGSRQFEAPIRHPRSGSAIADREIVPVSLQALALSYKRFDYDAALLICSAGFVCDLIGGKP